MGACATKPKVSKEDGQAPVPAPEPVPTETTMVEDLVPDQLAKTEEQNVLPVLEEEKEKQGKVVEAEVVDENNKVDDDQDSKRRSLSHLFKENENEKSEEAEKAPAEVVKQESSDTVKSKEVALEEQSVDPPTELVAPEPILIQESVHPTKQEKLETEKPEEVLKQEQPEMSTNELDKQEVTMTEIPLENDAPIEALRETELLVTEKPVESVVKQEPLVAEKSIEVLEKKLPTNEKSEIPVEPTESLTVVDAPAKVIEATPAVEPKTNDEKSGDKFEETKDLKISA